MSTSSSIEQNYQTLLAKPAGRARSAIFDSALRAISLLGDLFDNDRWENEKDDFNFRARQAGRSPKVVMHSPRVAQPAGSPVVGCSMKKQRWPDWVNLLLGVWMLVSPWVVGHDTSGAAILNYYVVGLAVTVFAIAALAAFRMWEEWVNLVFGTWLLVSPWFLGFSASSTSLLNTVLIAMFIIICAGSALTAYPE